jgi:hypothetical protein
MIPGTATSVNAFGVTSAAPDTVTLTVSGDWSIRHGLPSLAELGRVLTPPATVRRVVLKATELGHWDSALMTFLFAVAMLCGEHGVVAEMGSLPPDVRRLIELATAVPRHDHSAVSGPRPILLARIGAAMLHKRAVLLRVIAFLGESVIAFARLLRGRARYRRADLVLAIEECGSQALPIVSIISLLVGNDLRICRRHPTGAVRRRHLRRRPGRRSNDTRDGRRDDSYRARRSNRCCLRSSDRLDAGK